MDMDPLQEPLAGGVALERCTADVDPPPRPWSSMEKLAIAAIVAIVVFGCHQFLPPTHFRPDPNDPQRNWISIDGSRNPTGSLNDVGSVDVFSWINCLDLRTLAVMANSTLSSSSDPQKISFHFLMPEGGNDKSSYHKLKVLLPDSDLTVTSQKQIKDKLNVATPEGNFLWLFHMELSPFLIAKSLLSKNRYVYISSDSIIKGKVEDLARMDLGSYGIGAGVDCSKRLNDYISMDVLSAIQRAGAAYSWMPKEPYKKDACLLDFDVLLIEPRKLEKHLAVPIMWWANVINIANQRGLGPSRCFIEKSNSLTTGKEQTRNQKKKRLRRELPSNWKRTDDNADIINFDGPKNVCSEDGCQLEQSGYGATWQQYLDQNSEAILNA